MRRMRISNETLMRGTCDFDWQAPLMAYIQLAAQQAKAKHMAGLAPHP